MLALFCGGEFCVILTLNPKHSTLKGMLQDPGQQVVQGTSPLDAALVRGCRNEKKKNSECPIRPTMAVGG